MNKKLLLTTAMTTALLASPAVAEQLTTVYNGAGKVFTVNGADGNPFKVNGADAVKDGDIKALFDFITGENFKDNTIKLDDATKSNFLDDLFDKDDSALRNAYATVLADKITDLSAEDATKKLNAAVENVHNILDKLGEAGVGMDINGVEVNEETLNSFFDFAKLENIAKEGITDLVGAINYLSNFVEARTKANIIEAKYNVLAQEVADAGDAELQAKIDEQAVHVGTDVAHRAADFNEKLAALRTAIANVKGAEKIRLEKETQESFKLLINQIKAAEAGAATNEALKAQAAEDKAALEINKARYVFTNSINSSNVADVPNFQKSDAAGTEALINAEIANLQTIANVVDGRIGSFTGLAAGDPFETFGVWVKGTFAQGKQKARGVSEGYKFDQKGATIGADTGDESMVGIAYTYMQNDVKSKAANSAKDDIISHTGTLYGRYAITNDMFISAQGQYGSATVKKKITTDGNNTVKAKPDATMYALRAQVGYAYNAAQDVSIVPTIGFAHTQIEVDGYKATGTGINREISKRKSTRTSGIAGVTAKYVSNMGTMKLVPEVHANIDYAFNTKNDGTKIKVVDGVTIPGTPSQKIEKGFYNIGASLKVIQDNMFEVTGGYDLGLAKKFQSHTGTLKLRVNL